MSLLARRQPATPTTYAAPADDRACNACRRSGRSTEQEIHAGTEIWVCVDWRDCIRHFPKGVSQ